MKQLLSILLAFTLLFSLCACNDSSSDTEQTNNGQTESTILEVNVQTAVFMYIENSIKATLKNPNSFSINSISERAEPIIGDKYTYYIVSVDYSAQNGFGGYNREQELYYVKATNDGKTVSSISEYEYYNATDEYLYKEHLSKLEAANRIPFALICTASTYNDVGAFLKNANVEYTIYYNDDDSPKEIQYLCDMFGFTGVVQIAFNKNKTISEITYGKYNGQIYYDANTNKTITFEDDTGILSQADVSKFKSDITDTLVINGIEKDEDGLSYYTSRSCEWTLSNSLTVKMKWDTLLEDNSVCYLSITFENSMNANK